MTSIKVLDEKLKALPEEACLELLEYVDYLLYKYADEPMDTTYDELLEALVTKRYQAYKSNPDSASSSEDFSQRINQKFGWSE